MGLGYPSASEHCRAALLGTRCGSNRRSKPYRGVLLSLGSALAYFALAAAEGFWAILLATATIAVFGTAVLPITIS